MTRSSVELRDLLVTLLKLHPIKDLQRIIELNDEMKALLDRQRQEFHSSNKSLDEADQRRNNGFIAFFNSYMEYAVLTNYMYPFLNMIQRFAIELKVITTDHVFHQKTKVAPAQNIDFTEDKLYFHLMMEYVHRDEHDLYQIVNADLKYYVIKELYRQKKLSFKDFPADPFHLETIKNVIKSDLWIQLSTEETDMLQGLISEYLDYHFSFKRVNFTEIVHHMNSKPVIEMYPYHEPLCGLLQDKLFEAYGNCVNINPTYSPKTPFISFSHRQYLSFKDEYYRFSHSEITMPEVLMQVPPFMKTYEDIRVTFLTPLYRNGSIDGEVPMKLTLRNSSIASREELYGFISGRVGYEIRPLPIMPKKAPRRTHQTVGRKKNKKKIQRNQQSSSTSPESEPSTETSGDLDEEVEVDNPVPKSEKVEPVSAISSPSPASLPVQKSSPKKADAIRTRNLCESLESFKSSQIFTFASFRISFKSMKTLCLLNNEARGTIKWPAFVHLMTELGFRMDKDRAGSRVGFISETKRVAPLIVHQPHPGQVVSRLMRKVSVKKLSEHGIIPDKFKLL